MQEAWELLEESRARLSFDKRSLNPTFSYFDDQQPNTAPGLVPGRGDRLRSNRRGIAGAAHRAWHCGGWERKTPAFGSALAAAGRRMPTR